MHPSKDDITHGPFTVPIRAKREEVIDLAWVPLLAAIRGGSVVCSWQTRSVDARQHHRSWSVLMSRTVMFRDCSSYIQAHII